MFGFNLCEKCLVAPWSQSIWEKLEAGQRRFVYQVSTSQLANGAKAKCWWCCVALDTVSEGKHQFLESVDIDVDLGFYAPLQVEPEKISTLHLALQRKDVEEGDYEVLGLGITAKHRKFTTLFRLMSLTTLI
jgi:hypothetical protein